MTPQQIDLVQSSFAKVKPIASQAADIFYNRLFEIRPDVRGLFKGDMGEQGKKLMATLATVVASLRNVESILPSVDALAQRHAGYGVQTEHYTAVGEALIYALQQGLGEEFTENVKSAWISAYTLVSNRMIERAYSTPV